MLFIAACVDRPRSLDARQKNLPAPLVYPNRFGAPVKAGGALPAPDHQTEVGSMIIFEG
jgi:hypothetical protein